MASTARKTAKHLDNSAEQVMSNVNMADKGYEVFLAVSSIKMPPVYLYPCIRTDTASVATVLTVMVETCTLMNDRTPQI